MMETTESNNNLSFNEEFDLLILYYTDLLASNKSFEELFEALNLSRNYLKHFIQK